MKRVLLIIYFTAISICSYGQVDFGLKIGLNVASLIDASDDESRFQDYNPKISLNGGIVTSLQLSDKFSFIGELAYTDKGASYNNPMTGSKGNLSLNYINLSFLPQYHFTNKISGLLGLELGYLFSAISRADNEKFNVSSFWDNKIDLGLTTGLAYTINEKLAIDTRYIFGLLYPVSTKIFFTEDGQNSMSSMIKFRNHVLQFNVHYIFR